MGKLQHALAFLAQWSGKNPGRPGHHPDVSLRSSGHGGLSREQPHDPLIRDPLCGAEGPGRPAPGATEPRVGGQVPTPCIRRLELSPRKQVLGASRDQRQTQRGRDLSHCPEAPTASRAAGIQAPEPQGRARQQQALAAWPLATATAGGVLCSSLLCFFWPPRHMELPGRGSDLSCSCDLHHIRNPRRRARD